MILYVGLCLHLVKKHFLNNVREIFRLKVVIEVSSKCHTIGRLATGVFNRTIVLNCYNTNITNTDTIFKV